MTTEQSFLFLEKRSSAIMQKELYISFDEQIEAIIYQEYPEVYSKISQTSKMELFAKTDNGLHEAPSQMSDLVLYVTLISISLELRNRSI